jgi:hypothetical protein
MLRVLLAADFHCNGFTDAPTGHVPDRRALEVEVEAPIRQELFPILALGWSELTQAGTDTQRIPFIARVNNLRAGCAREYEIVRLLASEARRQQRKHLGVELTLRASPFLVAPPAARTRSRARREKQLERALVRKQLEIEVLKNALEE